MTVKKINENDEYKLFKFFATYYDEEELEEVWNNWIVLRDEEQFDRLNKRLKEDKDFTGFSPSPTDSSPPTPCPIPTGSKGNSKGGQKGKKKDSSIGKSSWPSPRRNLYVALSNSSEESATENSPEAKRQKNMCGKKTPPSPEQGL